MAKGVYRLTARDLKRKTAGTYGDGLGLWLQVSAGKHGTNRSWEFRYTVHGRPRYMGLGSVHTVGLAGARELARECRELRLRGIDPIEHRKAQRAAQAAAAKRAMSFDECARAYMAAKRAEWRSAKHAGEWVSTLARDVSPAIGKLPVETIDTALVVRALKPVWERAPESASRLRGRIEAILDWAAVSGFRSADIPNPARWPAHLEHVFAAPSKRAKEHLAAMPFADVPAFMAKLRAVGGTAAIALEFLILTAARRGEVLGATWGEINRDEAVWEIPSARMKSGKLHRVPLSPRCIEILRQQRSAREGDLIFPGQSGALNENAFRYIMRRLGVGQYTAHGFRSSFRDWCGEHTNFPREIAEAALAHATGDRVEQAYRRGDAIEKRRKLMNAWASYCGRPVAAGDVVVPMRKAGADA
jgi:integrase